MLHAPGEDLRCHAETYKAHGVRTFSLDTQEQLDKIVAATDGATDLSLCVRLRVSSEYLSS